MADSDPPAPPPEDAGEECVTDTETIEIRNDGGNTDANAMRLQNDNYFVPTPSSGSNEADSEQEERDRFVNEDEGEESMYSSNNMQTAESETAYQSQNQDESSYQEDGDGEWTYDMIEMSKGSQSSQVSTWEDRSFNNYGGGEDSRNVDDENSQEDFNNSKSEDTDAPKTFKIFVSNLPPGIQNSELQELFEKYGEVVECEIFTKNYYAFVHLTSEESGEKAVKELNGYELHGCKLNVKRSHNKGKGKRQLNKKEEIPQVNLETATYKIYIGGLPQDVTKEFVTKLLEEYGRVVEVEVYRGNAAFVHMETEEGAKAVMENLNGKTLEESEKPLSVSASKNPEGPSVPTTKLKVTNLSLKMSAEELRSLFIPYGLVLRAKIFKGIDRTTNSRKAIVYLEQYGNIRSAIKDLDGKDVEGQAITVEPFFGNEEDLEPPKPLPKPSSFRHRQSEPIYKIPRGPPVPMPNSSGRRLVPMPSQEDIWGAPAPGKWLAPMPSQEDIWSCPPPMPPRRRLIPMPSQEEVQRIPRFGHGRGGRGGGRGNFPNAPTMNPFRSPNFSRYQNDFSYDEQMYDEFGGGYSGYRNDAGYDEDSFGPPKRKIPRNNRNQKRNNQNSGSRNSNSRENPFPELPPPEEFPPPPKSLMQMQTPNSSSAAADFDYSADLPLSTFSDFTQDFTCDDPVPSSSSLNAVPFDYSQMNKRKNFHNKQAAANYFNAKTRGGAGGGGVVPRARGVRGGRKIKERKLKAKARRPGLGSAAQQKRFANQAGIEVSDGTAAAASTSEQIPGLMSAQIQDGSQVAASEPEASSASDNSPYAPYYFQQRGNPKDKKGNNNKRRPTAKELKQAEDEQKRQYAEYLKQKPWLYQAIPGTVKKVQQ